MDQKRPDSPLLQIQAFDFVLRKRAPNGYLVTLQNTRKPQNFTLRF